MSIMEVMFSNRQGDEQIPDHQTTQKEVEWHNDSLGGSKLLYSPPWSTFDQEQNDCHTSNPKRSLCSSKNADHGDKKSSETYTT